MGSGLHLSDLFLTPCDAERRLCRGGLGGGRRGLPASGHLAFRLYFAFDRLCLVSRVLSSHFKENISGNIKTTGSQRLTCLFYYTVLFGRVSWQGRRVKRV